MSKTYHTTKVGNEYITTSSGGACSGLGCGGMILLCIILSPFVWIYENFGGTGLVILLLIVALIVVIYLYCEQREKEKRKKF